MARFEQRGLPSDAIARPVDQRSLGVTRSPVADIFSSPVRSSAERPGWSRVLVELHRGERWEGNACLPFNLVSLLLHPPRRLDYRLDHGPVRRMRPATGDVMIIPSGRSHWAAWESHAEFMLAYLAPEVLAQTVRDDGFDADRFELVYRGQAQDAQLASLLLALHAALVGPGEEDRLYVDTIAVQLAIRLLQEHGTAPLQLREYRHGLSRVKMRLVLDYLNTYMDRNIQLAELARLVEMSQFHFLRLFRTSCGKTPHQYLVERRVEVAKSILLHDDVSLADVAYRLGFTDQSHFTRHFRRITGAPPGRLRRASRPPTGS